MNSEQETRLRETIAETLNLNPEEIDDTSGADTIREWTSLAHLSIMAAVEETFGIQFTMEQMAHAKTVSDLKAVIAPLL